MSKYNRRFVIGDIHGKIDKLLTLLRLSKFDKEKDLLISIGDICDRGEDSWAVAETLMSLKNFIFIRGNHDFWMQSWLLTSNYNLNWYRNGGDTTIYSYEIHDMENKAKHLEFYKSALPYYVLDNKCFVHGGLNPDFLIKDHSEESMCRDRSLVEKQLSYNNDIVFADGFEEVFIGHTPTTNYGISTPVIKNKVINVDTGSGKGGLLTIMDIDTKEYIQA